MTMKKFALTLVSAALLVGSGSAVLAAPQESANDASTESRAGGTSFAQEIESEKKRLDTAGFPQYNQ
jgi:hypothetical protein